MIVHCGDIRGDRGGKRYRGDKSSDKLLLTKS